MRIIHRPRCFRGPLRFPAAPLSQKHNIRSRLFVFLASMQQTPTTTDALTNMTLIRAGILLIFDTNRLNCPFSIFTPLRLALRLDFAYELGGASLIAVFDKMRSTVHEIVVKKTYARLSPFIVLNDNDLEFCECDISGLSSVNCIHYCFIHAISGLYVC